MEMLSCLEGQVLSHMALSVSRPILKTNTRERNKSFQDICQRPGSALCYSFSKQVHLFVHLPELSSYYTEFWSCLSEMAAVGPGPNGAVHSWAASFSLVMGPCVFSQMQGQESWWKDEMGKVFVLLFCFSYLWFWAVPRRGPAMTLGRKRWKERSERVEFWWRSCWRIGSREKEFQELVEAIKWFIPPVSYGFMLVNMPYPQHNYCIYIDLLLLWYVKIFFKLIALFFLCF